MEGKTTHYEYEYEVEGKKELFRDTWVNVDKYTYKLKVTMKIDEDWKAFTNSLVKRIVNCP